MKDLNTLKRQVTALTNQDFAHKFGATTNYRPPHQALLLLVVSELFAANSNQTRLVTIHPLLKKRYKEIFQIVTGSAPPTSIVIPFQALGSYKFWKLELAREGAAGHYRSETDFNKNFRGAILSSEFHSALRTGESRREIAETIVHTQFSPGLWFKLGRGLRI